MGWLLDSIMALVGAVGGFWLFSHVVLPLCYGMPRLLAGWMRGRLSLKPFFLYLASFLLWNVFFTVVFIVLLTYFPPLFLAVTQGVGFNAGSMIGFWLTALRAVFSVSARKAMRLDFEEFVSPHSRFPR